MYAEYDALMIGDTVPLDDIAEQERPLLTSPVRAFLGFVQRHFGVDISVDARALRFPDAELGEARDVAVRLLDRGTLLTLWDDKPKSADEPRLFTWKTRYANTADGFSSGSSVTNRKEAFLAAIAEGLERRLWKHEMDYFRKSHKKPMEALSNNYISPLRFAGFSAEQRSKNRGLYIDPNTTFHWIEAHSLVSGNSVFVPAQTATGSDAFHIEPLIRPIITTGLATYTTKAEAELRGALEVIERDAYMIMWLNQLSLPRLDLTALAAEHTELSTLLGQLDAYLLSVEAVRMITDAPAHAICAVVRDTTGIGPSVTVATAAGTRLAETATHAIAEAVRIRRHFREYWLTRIDPATIEPKNILFQEHGLYWLHGDRHTKLSFMTAAPVEKDRERASWEDDTPEEHLAKIVQWARERAYEICTVEMTHSAMNPTAWHVVNVLIPELQPLHLVERYPCAHGKRISEIPKMFGYAPRPSPFLDEPHPFV